MLTGSTGTNNWYGNRQILATTDMDSLMVVMLGTNDLVYSGGLIGYQAAYTSWLQTQISLGWNPANIILVSSPYVNPAGSNGGISTYLSTMDNIVKTIAAQFGCIFVSGYTATSALGNAAIQNTSSTGLHLSIAGHAALASAISSAIQSNGINY